MTNQADRKRVPSSPMDVMPVDPPVFFFHAGGIPLAAISTMLDSTGCLGRPRNAFDLDGRMWANAHDSGSTDFEGYLTGQIDEARVHGRRFSALIDWRDLLWLDRRPAFQELLCHPFRAEIHSTR